MTQKADVNADSPAKEDSWLAGLLRRFSISGHFLDPRFFGNWRQYLFQCLFVTATMVVVLALLDSVSETVLVAALGASSVVAFSAPSLRASRPRCLIGGYLVGVAVGCGMSLLVTAAGGLVSLDEHSSRILLGAIAVGLAMFIMVATNTEHPPGAAIAFGLVLHEWDLLTIVVVLAGISAISLIKELARGRLIDLL
jgi:CBS-domain-containing membrane protein